MLIRCGIFDCQLGDDVDDEARARPVGGAGKSHKRDRSSVETSNSSGKKKAHKQDDAHCEWQSCCW